MFWHSRRSAGQTNTDLMIASGDYPDLIGMFSYASGMDAAIEDEVVVDIKEDIPTLAPDYYKYLIENDNELWRAVQTDEGHIGAFVVVGTEPEIQDGMMVFQFMLDELGFTLDDLKTINGYEQYLTAAKDKYGMASPCCICPVTLCSMATPFVMHLGWRRWKIDAITGDLPWTVQEKWKK